MTTPHLPRLAAALLGCALLLSACGKQAEEIGRASCRERV